MKHRHNIHTENFVHQLGSKRFPSIENIQLPRASETSRKQCKGQKSPHHTFSQKLLRRVLSKRTLLQTTGLFLFSEKIAAVDVDRQ
jgi:hypothetical protein